MTDFDKTRLKQLAGLNIQESEEAEQEQLQEFRMFGVASPSPMADGFRGEEEGQQLSEQPAEPDPGEEDIEIAKHNARNAMEALQRAIQKGSGEDQEAVRELEDQMSTVYNKLTSME